MHTSPYTFDQTCVKAPGYNRSLPRPIVEYEFELARKAEEEEFDVFASFKKYIIH